jgi:hypothetical protein
MDRSLQAAEARLIAASHAREAADFARGIVGDTTSGSTAMDRIRAARRLRLMDLQVLQWTVRAEVLLGTPWPEIAAALDRDEESVRAEFEASTLQWAERNAREPQPIEEVIGEARDLDAWYRKHREDVLDPGTDAPVSGLFASPPGPTSW